MVRGEEQPGGKWVEVMCGARDREAGGVGSQDYRGLSRTHTNPSRPGRAVGVGYWTEKSVCRAEIGAEQWPVVVITVVTCGPVTVSSNES